MNRSCAILDVLAGCITIDKTSSNLYVSIFLGLFSSLDLGLYIHVCDLCLFYIFLNFSIFFIVLGVTKYASYQ